MQVFQFVSYFRPKKVLARITDTDYAEISSLKSVIIIYMFHFVTVTLVSYIFKYPPKKVCMNRHSLCNCNILNMYFRKLMLKFTFKFFSSDFCWPFIAAGLWAMGTETFQ